MKSETLAMFIIGLMTLIAYAVSVAHDMTEGIAIVCSISLTSIIYYGLYFVILVVIKDIRNED